MPKVAAIQMTSTRDVEKNLKIVERLLQIAADSGARLVVLPEMFPLQSPEAIDKIVLSESLGQDEIQSFLYEQAQKHQLWIIGGTIPIQSPEKNKVYATSLVINAEGQCIAHYNKIHLFDVTISEHEQYHESATTMPGNALCLVDTPIGKLGVAVCYDIRFPELFRCLFNQGAEIFALPCAFTQKTGKAHFELLLRARAIENFSYVIAACQVGGHGNNRKTYGHSMIINPWGEVLDVLPAGEGVVLTDIDLSFLKKIRQDLPVMQHQKMILKDWIISL